MGRNWLTLQPFHCMKFFEHECMIMHAKALDKKKQDPSCFLSFLSTVSSCNILTFAVSLGFLSHNPFRVDHLGPSCVIPLSVRSLDFEVRAMLPLRIRVDAVPSLTTSPALAGARTDCASSSSCRRRAELAVPPQVRC